jgi:hypothetical protein
MIRWKLMVVLLMSLWLPLQGIAALVMPFCKHGLGNSATSLDAMHHQHDERHSAHTGYAQDETASASLLSACDDCGHCHLSSTLSLPSPAFPDTDTVTFAAPSFSSNLPRGFVPRRLHPPPLPALI